MLLVQLGCHMCVPHAAHLTRPGWQSHLHPGVLRLTGDPEVELGRDWLGQDCAVREGMSPRSCGVSRSLLTWSQWVSPALAGVTPWAWPARCVACGGRKLGRLKGEQCGL